MKINIQSEIGELEGVILHTPGPEVENMTPQNAERALYSDILNLSVAQKEYAQLADLLGTVTQTYQVHDLLESILAEPAVKAPLVLRICEAEGCLDLCDDLLALPLESLARQLIEGVVQPRDNLTRFLSKERFCLPPLHNFFFTRDAAMAIMDEILIGRMAKPVRARESIIMEAIFNHSPRFSVNTVNPLAQKHPDIAATVEGGTYSSPGTTSWSSGTAAAPPPRASTLSSNDSRPRKNASGTSWSRSCRISRNHSFTWTWFSPFWTETTACSSNRSCSGRASTRPFISLSKTAVSPEYGRKKVSSMHCGG